MYYCDVLEIHMFYFFILAHKTLHTVSHNSICQHYQHILLPNCAGYINFYSKIKLCHTTFYVPPERCHHS